MWGFPEISHAFLEDQGSSPYSQALRRIVELWGLYWGPPISGNYHARILQCLECTGSDFRDGSGQLELKAVFNSNFCWY